MKNFRKKLPQKKLYSEYIKIMNGILGLSKRETEVYSFMMKLNTEWQPRSDKDFKDIISTENRRLIIKECNINKTNLSRFIMQLKGMNLLIVNADGGHEIPSTLSIDLSDKIIEVVFTLDFSDDGSTGSNY